MDEIGKMDTECPPSVRPTTAAEVNCLLRRAAKIEELLTENPPQAENWWEQLLDNLGAVAYKERADSLLGPAVKAVQDGPGMTRLKQRKDQLVKGRPGTNLAGHATFVELCARFLPLLESERAMNDLKKVQEEWHDALTKFVTDYPAVKDTPDALNYLAIGAEFAGKDEEAKRWYRLIYTNFPTHALAEKSRGCVRRLEAIGQPMELVSPTLDGRNTFDITTLKANPAAGVKGKVVAVYYWASYCQSCPREFAVLKQLHSALQIKGLELVCVNLDDNPADAVRFLTANPLPGIHLFQAAKAGGGVGLNGPLAVHYGINGLPTLFLIGRDGKVVNTTLQAFDLEPAVNKQL